MRYEKLEEFVSTPRLDRYLTNCINSKDRALLLYAANLRTSQAFYPIMNLFEVFLRNSINNKLSLYFGDTDWIINQKTGFMNHPSLSPKYWVKNRILESEKGIRGTIISAKIIADQTLGFWTSLFEPRHFGLVGGHIIHCFPNKPKAVNRTYLANKLKDIREFRNRIYHNEAICFKGSSIDFAQANDIKIGIYNILEWMDIDLKNYTLKFDEIDQRINHALSI